MWIRVQGKARGGSKTEHTRKYVSPAIGGKPVRNAAMGPFLRWLLSGHINTAAFTLNFTGFIQSKYDITDFFIIKSGFGLNAGKA